MYEFGSIKIFSKTQKKEQNPKPRKHSRGRSEEEERLTDLLAENGVHNYEDDYKGKTYFTYNNEEDLDLEMEENGLNDISEDYENYENEFEKEIIISPNPTNNFVNIELNCIEQLINYQINDVNRLMIYQSSVQNNTGNLLVDFTSYPVGVYFVSIECNNLLKTYKIVKEG